MNGWLTTGRPKTFASDGYDKGQASKGDDFFGRIADSRVRS
jgi:hypothetical protein